MSNLHFILFLILLKYSSQFELWSSSPASETEPDTQIKKSPPKSCPHYHVTHVRGKRQGNMEDVWVVTHIIPRGKSQYIDGSPACGLYNFVPGECKCLRYSLSIDDEENSISRKTIGLEVRSQNFRYIESRIVFIEDHHDVFQAQFLRAAQINFEGTESKLTTSPIDEEIYPEYQSYALLATDNYESYAVYASCTPSLSVPHAWVAFSNAVFMRGDVDKYLQKIENVLSANGIDYRNMAVVDHVHCKPSQ